MDEETSNTQVDDALQAMEDVRRQLAEVPAQVVVTNHVMGLYELAAIHLSANPPDLFQAALAIDSVGCLVEGLGDRLGDEAPTMRNALGNIRLAFVQIKNQVSSQNAADGIDEQADSAVPGDQGDAAPDDQADSATADSATADSATADSAVADEVLPDGSEPGERRDAG